MFSDFKPKGKLPKEEIKKINGKIKDLFTSHLGYTIVSSADTIVISAFLGLTILAQYQNYYYIMSSIIGFMSIIYASITAGVGNSMLTKTKEQNYEEFKTFTLLVSFVSGLCCACFMTLYQPFMTIWMGKNMLLSQLVVVLLCFYFWFYELVMMISVYKDAGGIWHEDRFRPLIAGVTNLIINLLLVNFMGLYGIILSTIASQLFISLPWIVKNVTALIFNRNPREYFKIIIINTLKVLFSTTVVYVIVSFIHIENVYGLILKGISTVFLAVFILMICFRQDEQYNNAKELLFKLLKLDKVLKKR